jgi:hypothetical protein
MERVPEMALPTEVIGWVSSADNLQLDQLESQIRARRSQIEKGYEELEKFYRSRGDFRTETQRRFERGD